MSQAIRDYLEKFETGSLKMILDDMKMEKEPKYHEVSRKILEDILKEREPKGE